MGYKISVGGKKFDVEIGPIVDGQARVSVNNQVYEVMVDNFAEVAAGIAPAAAAEAPAVPVKPARSAVSLLKPAHASFVAGDDALTAPIPGLILEVRVKVGDRVSAGQIVTVMEAMKMENNECPEGRRRQRDPGPERHRGLYR